MQLTISEEQQDILLRHLGRIYKCCDEDNLPMARYYTQRMIAQLNGNQTWDKITKKEINL